MEDLVRIFKSPEGDVYHITLSEDHRVLSQEVLESLGNIRVVGIELRRLAGTNATGHDVLAALEDDIAEVFLQKFPCDLSGVTLNVGCINRQ